MKHGIKRIIKRCIRMCGLEIQSVKYSNCEAAVLRDVLRVLQPALVLDVGANVGQFVSAIREAGYQGHIVSFEAVPEIHALLADKARHNPRWTVAPCAALGASSGLIEINVSANAVSSSVLPMREAHLDAAPDSAYVERRTVPLERLDVHTRNCVAADGDIFLKIDTQGYEMEVLKGSTALLPRVTGIQVELSLIPLYDRAPTIVEMIGYLDGLGYALFNLVPGYKDLRTGRVLQVDGFFVARDRSPPPGSYPAARVD